MSLKICIFGKQKSIKSNQFSRHKHYGEFVLFIYFGLLILLHHKSRAKISSLIKKNECIYMKLRNINNMTTFGKKKKRIKIIIEDDNFRLQKRGKTWILSIRELLSITWWEGENCWQNYWQKSKGNKKQIIHRWFEFSVFSPTNLWSYVCLQNVKFWYPETGMWTFIGTPMLWWAG